MKKTKKVFLILILIFIFKSTIVHIFFRYPYEKLTNFNLFEYKSKFTLKKTIDLKDNILIKLLNDINENINYDTFNRLITNFNNNFIIKKIVQNDLNYIQINNNETKLIFIFKNDKLSKIETDCNFKKKSLIYNYNYLLDIDKRFKLINKYNEIKNNTDFKWLITNLGTPDKISITGSMLVEKSRPGLFSKLCQSFLLVITIS